MKKVACCCRIFQNESKPHAELSEVGLAQTLDAMVLDWPAEKTHGLQEDRFINHEA